MLMHYPGNIRQIFFLHICVNNAESEDYYMTLEMSPWTPVSPDQVGPTQPRTLLTIHAGRQVIVPT